ncbi:MULTISPECIES: hypothetical protein [unclassified Rhizobium]|uniref:hypothetical protein n=1 Tax=Rhizobium/Agrobacterium group TaxID=227290 RepID=UPI00177B612E|nr:MULTISPECIES: hypothetical protein [unclassified Rhizobium]MBD8662644.1 hypothetical protein [Rhizobium sp. CFBP 8752]MBP2461672.1 hypothetical protein [Rhizobium sp. PvP014]MBP2529067.1 hypothetical protein [Rhizobium sp. PvP099]
MRLIGKLLSACIVALSVSGCNTSEALTPRAEIGGGSRASTPVTQADTERMARSPRPETYQNQTYRNDTYQPRPQNTLEAQAQAMQSGNQTSPASSGPPPEWQGQSQAEAQSTAAAPQQEASLPAAAGNTIRFLPIIGAPVQAVTPLSRRLGAEARAAGLTIRPSSDTGTEQILKGYFSAFSDGEKITIVYVWDVLDNTGSRLHRMQGQENVPGSGQDPWASVPSSTMELIAAKTIQDYMSWRQSHGG